MLHLAWLLVLHTRDRRQCDLNTAVLRTAVSRCVAGNRVCRACATYRQVLTADTLRRQVARHALRTLLRKLHVVVVVTGAAIDHNNRGKGALIGAAVAGLGAAGYGYYADKQEAALRASMANTGVEVQRQGDNITLVMPGNITFATNSANIAPSFYQPLNNLANSLKQFNNQNQIQIVGYTDSTGNYNYNMQPSAAATR